MKKILFVSTLIVVALTTFSCNKILGKTCYECTAIKIDGSTLKKDVCVDEGESVGQLVDDNGNELATSCQKK